jgi:hypothetical protein
MFFIAHYDDGPVEGGPLGTDSGWTSLPDQPIRSLEYVTPYGDAIVLRGYDEYLHMVEARMGLGSPSVIEYLYLMGRKDDYVISYRLTIQQQQKNSRFKVGDITVRKFPWGKEYKGAATQGWRRGK